MRGLSAGRVLETYRRFYAHNVVISEHRVPLVGRAENEGFFAFVNGKLLHGARLEQITIDGTVAAIQWLLHTHSVDGTPQNARLVTIQLWQRGRIVSVDDSYSGGNVDLEPHESPAPHPLARLARA